MASELVNKIKKLQNAIIKRSNEQFKKNAVELINPEKADEDLFVAPTMPEPDEVEEAPSDTEPEVAEISPEERDLPHGYYLKVEALLRKSISEEQEAASAYIKRASKCLEHGDYKLASLFEELASDEIIHAASLETALDMYGMFDPYKFLQGQAEAEYILQEDREDIVKKEKKAREQAEKERKEFDFVKEYTDDKAGYEKEKIVNAINDLILGKNAVDDVVDVVMKSAKSAKLAKKDGKKEKKAEK